MIPILLSILAGVVVVVIMLCLASALSRCPHCRGYHASEAEQASCEESEGGK